MADGIYSQELLPEGLAQTDFSKMLPIILFAGGLFLVAMLVLVIRSVIISYRSSSRAALALARAQQKAVRRNNFLIAVYRMVSKIPGLRKYLKTVEHSYLGICRYDNAVLVRHTSETIVVAFLISAASVIAVLSMNLAIEKTISFYSVASAVLAVYVVSVEVLHKRIRSKEKKLTEDLIHYFANVKHKYLAKKNIPQAVIDAAEGMSYEISMHAMEVHDILSGTERKERVREYALNPRTNPYMKLFISQVYEASERGDTIEEGSDASLLTGNLEVLRVEMMRDSCRKDTRDFKFQGYSLVTCVPVFFMALLKSWGMDFSSEMVGFYESTGYIVMFLAFVATTSVYDNVNKAKEVHFARSSKDNDVFDRLPRRNIIRRFMDLIEIRHSEGLEKIRGMLVETGVNRTLGAFVARMVVCALLGTVIGIVFFASFHITERKRLLTEVNNIDNVVYVASVIQKQAIVGHILDMTRDFLHAEDLSDQTLARDFKNRMHLPNEESVANICNEVRRRVTAYHEEYFRWHEFVLAIIFGVAAAYIPYISLKYRYSIVQAGKNDEIRQFQSIIIMERAFPDVTTQEILEEMETFARVFKKSIRKCLNCYSAGPVEALTELRDSEVGCPDFVEIVDGFLAVETVGVAKAFAEVKNNREMSESSRVLYEEILLSKKMNLTDMISYIPALIVVGGYFIGPFCYYVFGSVMDMFDMLDTFSSF